MVNFVDGALPLGLVVNPMLKLKLVLFQSLF
jgi:hypothetical protein